MTMAKIRRKMFDVSEIMKYARVNIMKAETIGHLQPILSASFPEGMRESMFAIPLIPNRDAIRDGNRRRIFSAYTAKRVMKKANVKEKEKRTQVRIRNVREEMIILMEVRTLRFLPTMEGAWDFLRRIKRKGNKPRIGNIAVSWNSRA